MFSLRNRVNKVLAEELALLSPLPTDTLNWHQFDFRTQSQQQEMAFRSKFSRIVDVRSVFAVFRSPIVRRTRTLTSQSKQSASYFRFAGPFVIGATAVGAGLFAASRLYNNNFTFFGNVHAATKVICLDLVFICIYIGM